MAPLASVAAAAAVAAGIAAGAAGWRAEPPLPQPRGEVAAAAVGREVAIVGGYLADGDSSSRVDAYEARTRRWRRLPDLPVALNHAFAAGMGRRLYVAGGSDGRSRLRAAWVLEAGRWHPLPRLPYGLVAGGAAVVGARLYLVGGVTGSRASPVLAGRSLVLDLARPTRWRFAAGPTPRQHLGVAVAGGRIYAVGGRSSGYDTNTRLVESWRPGEAAWRRVAPLPEARGGTGAAAVDGVVVSVGGEAPSGTLARVYAYDARRDRWRRLDDLPVPRHGLGVASVGGRVYAVGGGTRPGLSVSARNESIAVR